MKIVAVLATFVAALVIIAVAVWLGFHLLSPDHPPGPLANTLEVRVVAVNGARLAAGDHAGPDAFEDADAHRFADTGQAPAGWKWMPVSESVQGELADEVSNGSANGYISRTANGQMSFLVADSPGLALTHAANLPAWRVRSVRLDTSGEMGPGLMIALDNEGGELMSSFTQNQIGHSVAIVIGGRIYSASRVLDRVSDLIEIHFPEGQRHAADQLRDALLSGSD